jgi:peroxiredoxin Q/BCP
VIRRKEGTVTAYLAVGDTAPDFTLPADGGHSVSLSAFKGKNVVLYFYPKDDTSGCTKEALEFNALRGAFEKANSVVIGMSPDPVKSHDKFKAKYDLSFPLVADEEKSALEAYGVWVEKSMYGRKYMGVERTTILIDTDGKIAAIWPKVKVDGHADEVLKKAQSLAG